MPEPALSIEMWKNLRRVLAVRLDNIGDLVMLSPALRAIKENLPEAHITLLTSPAGNQVAPLLPWVSEVMVWRAIWQDVSGELSLDPVRELNFIQELRRRDFDAAIILPVLRNPPILLLMPATWPVFQFGSAIPRSLEAACSLIGVNHLPIPATR
jgi:ADP-heptose:LPS heptosyltransferase